MQESRTRLMINIVRNSRLSSGVRSLTEEELTDLVGDWMLMLEIIPTERLEDAYHRAMLNRHYVTVLQPGELMAAWQVIASSEAEARNLKLAQQSFAERASQGLTVARIASMKAISMFALIAVMDISLMRLVDASAARVQQVSARTIR